MGTSRAAHLLWLAAVALTACDAPTVPREAAASDYAHLVGRNASGETELLVYHWSLGRTIRLYVDTTAEPAGTDLRGAVRAAIAQWSSTIYYGEFELRLVDDVRTADVVIHHAAAPFLVDVHVCDYPAVGGGGVTFFCPADSGDTLRVLPLCAPSGPDEPCANHASPPGRVKMDVRLDRSRVTSEERFRSLVAHELGHVLGIGGHSNDPADLLFGLPTADAPSARDVATLRWVLRQRADLRP